MMPSDHAIQSGRIMDSVEYWPHPFKIHIVVFLFLLLLYFVGVFLVIVIIFPVYKF